MIGKSDDLATLKTLTSTLNDSINGYRESPEKVESQEFREMFNDFAQQRERASSELKSLHPGPRPGRSGAALRAAVGRHAAASENRTEVERMAARNSCPAQLRVG